MHIICMVYYMQHYGLIGYYLCSYSAQTVAFILYTMYWCFYHMFYDCMLFSSALAYLFYFKTSILYPRPFTYNNYCGGELTVLKKEIWTLCILYLLSKKDRYGYDLISQLKSLFPDAQEPIIYSILRELCKNQYTKIYLSTDSLGPSRKYYAITATGLEKLDDLYNCWKNLKSSIERLGII